MKNRKAMMKQNLFLVALMIIGISFIACNKDDDHEDEINIEFLEPMNEEVVANPAEVHVHIRVTSNDEIHDVEIKMHPEEDEQNLIIDQDLHSHETSLDFEEDYDLSSYASGTEFHLSVRVAKDHEGSEFVEEDIHFSIP